ncbi:alpha/beta fold hydrolase [Streptomyces melanogenes]|uniref:alpha/beta fold hydrolase n=1 Tax=Streptomyces melanogenes TaxID=67326 RepID=UPI00167EFC77|nr:alpha/beta fold hydrolase [Streptomyces melanogenes]GGP86788.1 peptidase [Streptomyces melanogenes]
MSGKAIALTAAGILSAIAVLPTAAAALVPLDAPVPPPSRGHGSIQWDQCVREDVGDDVLCGKLAVPVDWSKPESGTTDLRVYRSKPAGGSKGTIINFPSGPGETGDIAFASLKQDLPGYDLVSFDPRGVSESSPLTCETDKALKIPVVPPTDPQRFDALRKNQQAFWSTCTTGHPGLDRHLDAYSTARDAEALRKAMELGKVNLHGVSYGTLLAERYLGLYGEHVNASVLEGVMNPAQGRREFLTTAAAGTEAVLDRFRKWCDAESACTLHGKDVGEVFRKARHNAAAGHIPGKDAMGRPWAAVSVGQYADGTLSSSFSDAAAGLLALSQGRNPLPEEKEGGEEETSKTFPYADPIVCSDFSLAVPNANQARRDLEAARRTAPVTEYSTNASQYASICLAGPRPAKDSSHPVTSRSANPTMLLSNSHDAATPVAWADKVTEQLGKKAIHVVTDKVGHGGGMQNPDTLRKVRAYVDRFNPTPAN